jgi:hypothetical protein
MNGRPRSGRVLQQDRFKIDQPSFGKLKRGLESPGPRMRGLSIVGSWAGREANFATGSGERRRSPVLIKRFRDLRRMIKSSKVNDEKRAVTGMCSGCSAVVGQNLELEASESAVLGILKDGSSCPP